VLFLKEIDKQSIKKNEKQSVICTDHSIQNKKRWTDDDEKEGEKPARTDMVFKHNSSVEYGKHRYNKKEKHERSSNEISHKYPRFFAKNGIYAYRYFGNRSKNSQKQK
jgi:hypothetical protein